MAPVRPMLGTLELQQAQQIEVDQDGVFAAHEIPALEGDFDQALGRRGAGIALSGVVTGADVQDRIKALRDEFRAGQPVSFAADIATATKLDQVLIQEMGIRELAGRPQRFEYAFALREFTPAPPPQVVPPPPPPPVPPTPPVGTGILEIEVIVEGQPDFDFSTVTVTVEGSQSDGTTLTATPATRTTGNVWRKEDLAPGQYTARAVVVSPEAMSGAATATLRSGETKRVQIVLRRGALIATAFVVHFRFDKSFVEPCMRGVLREAMQHAAAHADEKLVIVGHTDKTGSDAYNQSLSERRARSVFAYLTAGRDAAAARAEWAELRRPAAGALPTVRDTWGAHQYQYMLQDLGFYAGNVDGQHGPQTDAAVAAFRTAKGLPAGTTVDDAVWDALIADYLAVDQADMTLAEDRLLSNAKDGCDGGPLKWIGCGEEAPLPLPQPTRGDAFRPYRRVELLFVRTDRLPCEPPRPDTFDLPAPGAGGSAWCLGPAAGGTRCCFATRACETARPGQWCIVAADPTTVAISGSFTFEDGSPAANVRFVAIAPDGEYLAGERQSAPDRGDGVVARAGPDGKFAFPQQKVVGVVTVEVREQFAARLAGQPVTAAKGNVVCARVAAGGGSIDIVLTPIGPVAPPVNPTIATAARAVVVRKPHTNPARVAVTLGVDAPFTGTGRLTLSNPAAVRLFTAAVGGTQIQFDGTDDVFTGQALGAGVQLFAEAAAPSAAPDDVVLTLTLAGGGNPVGPPATATMTSVELTLDICLSRVSAAADPPAMSAADKVGVGRFVQVRDPLQTHERALLLVRPPNPGGFTGDLSLRARDARLAAFALEVPAAGQVALALPMTIPPATIPAGGARFFVEGTAISAAARDTGLQLGLAGGEPDGDSLAATVVQIEMTGRPTPVAPPLTFGRFGIWDAAYDAAGNVQNGVAEAANFVGSDHRRFHFRVRDPAAAGNVNVDWKTLRDDRTTDDDAPLSQALTLPETAAASRLFISRGVMLVTDDTDRDFPTNSGLAAPLDTGLRATGQSNHRTRRARIDGFVRGQYSPSPGVRLPIVRPVFNRAPDERRRVAARVIRYIPAPSPPAPPPAAGFVVATQADIDNQFTHANRRWNQVGIQIDAAAPVDRVIPAAALDAAGLYGGSANNPQEQAALLDLIPVTPDDTLTVVFVSLSAANAYATTFPRAPIPVPPPPPGVTLTLGERHFVFINPGLNPEGDTLAHELHHVLFNRGDDGVLRQFFTFNTNPSNSFGIPLPDVRVRRRVHRQHNPDPDVDAANDNVINWAKRRRTARFPIAGDLNPAATATTGNRLAGPF